MSASVVSSWFDKIGFLVRFWELRSRYSAGVLAAKEKLELLSLMQLVSGDLRLPKPGPFPRMRGAIPGQLIGAGTIATVDVRLVSASGLVVATSRSFTPKEQVVVRLADGITGVEYALPCSVLWVYDASPALLALSIDGIPSRTILCGNETIRSPLALGRHERMVG